MTVPREGPRRWQQPLLLLKRFPYGESSLVLHALAPDAGRVALLAKGAYRASSGFFAVFDLFDTLEARWSGRGGETLGLVTRATVRTRRAELARDLARYRAALALLELAHLTSREGHEERALYRWLEGHLDLLAAGAADPRVIAVAARLKLLRANGLAPALEACASCGRTGPERSGAAPFSAALGGRLCPTCATRSGAGATGSVSLNALRVAASLMDASPAMLARTRLDAALERSVRALVERFLETHLETRPRASGGVPTTS